jgi:hypothetical protein
MPKFVDENGDFVIPDAQRVTSSDTEKLRLQKRKKVKMMKQVYKKDI